MPKLPKEKETGALFEYECNFCGKEDQVWRKVVICSSQRLSHACLSVSHPCGKAVNGSLQQLWLLWCTFFTWIPVAILELIHVSAPNSCGWGLILSYGTKPGAPGLLVTHKNCTQRMVPTGDAPFKFLTYQLWAVGYWPTVAVTGNEELGFGFGEGA